MFSLQKSFDTNTRIASYREQNKSFLKLIHRPKIVQYAAYFMSMPNWADSGTVTSVHMRLLMLIVIA